MSKYQHYAKSFDEKFREIRQQHDDALGAYEKAKGALAKAESMTEYRYGDKAKAVASARYAMAVAKADLEHIRREVWPTLLTLGAELRSELASELEHDNVVNPGDIDQNALELLKSGIMTPLDYETMADKYEGNATMRRMIYKYAEKARQNAATADERRGYMLAANHAKDQQTAILESWDSLMGAAKYCSGQVRKSDTPTFVRSMANKWESICGDGIDNF